MNTKKINKPRTRLCFLLFLGLLGEYGLTALPVAAAPFSYVTNFDGNTVSMIDTATNAITEGHSPWKVAITPDVTRAHVTNSGENSVSVSITATNTVVSTITVGTLPTAVAVGLTLHGIHPRLCDGQQQCYG